MPVDGEPAVVETTHEASPVAMEVCPEEVKQCGEVAKDGDGKVPGKLLIVWFISNKSALLFIIFTDRYTFIFTRPRSY